ncbi:hypothetical protein [Sphingobacterium wenxiniae]|uniref:hypothetical protein n=1 Tax=Sphingobacterium wenxiniae TaxID=683125 RepID=UPI0014801B4C|nr:hypothetical protein [Sphingobacterium wenxiniae]
MKPLNSIQVGTLGGTLCSIFGSITMDDMIKTAVLAAVGAIVSYVVSTLLQRLRR